MRTFFLRALALLSLASVFAFFLYSAEPAAVAVLNYHRVSDIDGNALIVTVGEFDAQMKWLADEGYEAITADELADFLERGTKLPRKPVLITFDDGYADNYENAFPILQKYGHKALVFLITDYIGMNGYLSWSEIYEMERGGVVFGSHTVDHEVLTGLSRAAVFHELAVSKAKLDEKLRAPARFLAYPCGYADEDVKELTRRAGYRGAFTVTFGRDAPGDDMYELSRVPIFGATTHTLVRMKLRVKCPHLVATLEKLRKSLSETGHIKAAQWIPVI